MNNKVYYIKPTEGDMPTAIKLGFLKALELVKEKEYSNIKLVATHKNLIDPPNFLSEGIDQLFKGKGEILTQQLKKNRGFPLKGWPKEELTTGIQLLLANNNPSFIEDNTIVILYIADYDSFKKIQSELFWTSVDIIAIIQTETPELNELLSASKAINISSTEDPGVIPYNNNFPANVSSILSRLKGINITDIASHTPTQERMKSVVDELVQNNIRVTYSDFLGFLANDVNFKLEESVNLLNWKRKYFGR